MSLRVICAYGTRPEKIKTAPVIDALRAQGVEVEEWCSGQQRDLLGKDNTGSIIWERGWRAGVVPGIAETMQYFIEKLRDPSAPFDAVIVQGDTATAFACAQAAFLAGVPVAHVEAGLRTYAGEPWPEEAFRRQIAAVATWHFCPDEDAKQNVLHELGMRPIVTLHEKNDERELWQYHGVSVGEGHKGVHVTGNTVIDTLPRAPLRVLVTLHRRENWGTRIHNALAILNGFACEPNVRVTAISHPNWSAHIPSWLKPDAIKAGQMAIREPLDREELLTRISDSDVVVTDSGGLQEEAAHFGVPTLVLRTSTERVALERSGAIKLVDPDDPSALRRELDSVLARRRCYGDGTSGKRIAEILVRELTGVDNNGN